MTIGERIKEQRKKAGLTQAELGARCGISGAAIRQYELGIRNPKLDKLQRISDALFISLYDIIDVMDDPDYPASTFYQLDYLDKKYVAMVERVFDYSDKFSPPIGEAKITEAILRKLDKSIDELEKELFAFVEAEYKKISSLSDSEKPK